LLEGARIIASLHEQAGDAQHERRVARQVGSQSDKLRLRLLGLTMCQQEFHQLSANLSAALRRIFGPNAVHGAVVEAKRAGDVASARGQTSQIEIDGAIARFFVPERAQVGLGLAGMASGSERLGQRQTIIKIVMRISERSSQLLDSGIQATGAEIGLTAIEPFTRELLLPVGVGFRDEGSSHPQSNREEHHGGGHHQRLATVQWEFFAAGAVRAVGFAGGQRLTATRANRIRRHRAGT